LQRLGQHDSQFLQPSLRPNGHARFSLDSG
jgi:hypothetical protein